MITSANLFVSSAPTKTSALPSNSTVRSEDAQANPVSSGDTLATNPSENTSRGVEHVDKANSNNSKNTSRRQSNESVEAHEETKSKDKKSKGKDKNEFKQLIDEAMTEEQADVPVEAAAETAVAPETLPPAEMVDVQVMETAETAEVADVPAVEMVLPAVAEPAAEIVAATNTQAGKTVAVIPQPAQGTIPVLENPSISAPVDVEDAILPTVPQPQPVEVTDVVTADSTQAEVATPILQNPPKPADVTAEKPLPQTTATTVKKDAPVSEQTQQNASETTSGRPESTLPKANVPPMETPRASVEATGSSSDAKTAATETSPKSVESGTMTPGRPVVPSSADETSQADTSDAFTRLAMKIDTAATRQNHSEEQASSGDTSSQTPSKQATTHVNTKETDASTFAQAWQGAVNPYAPETRNAQPAQEQEAINVVASVTEATTATTDSKTTQDTEALLKAMDNFAPVSTSTTTATTSTTAAADTAATTGAKVTEQITTHIQANRTNLGEEMVIRLDPPELGRIRIQIRNQNGELTGVIRTDNHQTLTELQKESSSLMQRLNEAGVQIKTLDMGMSDMSQQGRGDQSFSQAQNAYSMFQQNQGEGRGYGYQHGGSGEMNENYQDDSQAHNAQDEQFATDSAVNVML